MSVYKKAYAKVSKSIIYDKQKLKNLLVIDKLTKYGTCKLQSLSFQSSEAAESGGNVFNPSIKGVRGKWISVS